MKTRTIENLVIALFLVLSGGAAIYGMILVTWIMIAEQLWIALAVTWIILIGFIVDRVYPYKDLQD